MTRSNLKELMAVLQGIRITQFPDIPAEVVEQIVSAQYDNQDDRIQARTKTLKIIADFMQTATGTVGDKED